MIFKRKMNKDLQATFINSLWRVVAGPISLLCLPYFLTAMEQGYWYTFTGIAALSVFADLGFTTIVLQFSAHEFAYLQFTADRTLCGDSIRLWRLASFFRFVLRWLGKVIGIVFPLIMIGGFFFLATKHDDLAWEWAWVIYSLATVGLFFNSAILSFFEGCNSVSIVQNIRFRMSVAQVSIMVVTLYLDFNIYALGLSILANVLMSTVNLLYYFRKTIYQLLYISKHNCYDWWPEFSALIWRYGISWSSGYFIFQIFTPIAFYFHGAVFSGKIGISIAMWTAGFSVANTWLTAIIPRLNMLIAKRKWQELDALFVKNLYRTVGTMVIGGGIYFLLYFTLVDEFHFFQRVLPPLTMAMLYISWIIQSWVNGIAFYLRAHKKEPLMQISVISGIWVSITTYLCAKFLPAEYLFLGFLSQYWGVFVVYRIYKKQQAFHYV